MIRNTTAGELMVLMIVAEDKPKETNDLMENLQMAFPQITSLQLILNQKKNDSYSDLKSKTFFGKPYVIENMEDLKFRVGPTSFYQTNAGQALILYQLVDKLAKVNQESLVYDLYSGTGTISQFLARKAKKVVGIEYVDAAVNDAKENAKLNNLSNTQFFAGDMAKVLNRQFVSTNGTPDILITDPPRAGMHPEVVQAILEMSPQKIVYVSCNPATQARDLALMKEQYEIKEIHPVDMFPHTHHVENVVLMEKR
jgi:23S rRNA (uracil1939-C5)-methyltransferase